MYENLLPIGSVVLLKGAERRLMITGRLQAMVGKTNVYDYAGCLYPEGLLDPHDLYFFDRDAIERVFFIGFQDSEGLALQERLAQVGELYVNEEGQIVERETAEAESEATVSEPEPEPEPEPVEEVVEQAVFADV